MVNGETVAYLWCHEPLRARCGKLGSAILVLNKFCLICMVASAVADYADGSKIKLGFLAIRRWIIGPGVQDVAIHNDERVRFLLSPC